MKKLFMTETEKLKLQNVLLRESILNQEKTSLLNSIGRRLNIKPEDAAEINFDLGFITVKDKEIKKTNVKSKTLTIAK